MPEVNPEAIRSRIPGCVYGGLVKMQNEIEVHQFFVTREGRSVQVTITPRILAGISEDAITRLAELTDASFRLGVEGT